MKRILVLFYSQSGETDRVAKLFGGELESAGHDVTLEALHPVPEFPYPWGSIRRFFDTMPETVVGDPPPIQTPQFDPAVRYDLIVIAFPVWFLSPALAIQGFFRTPQAAVLRGANVMTISVSRAMWQQGSEAMKRLLAAAGATHSDSVVVTHQGSPIATLISTPRALLSGKRDPLMGVFPEAGVAADDLARVRHLGKVTAERLNEEGAPGASLLKGEPAVTVKRWLVVPELLAWYCFYGSARLIRALGRIGPGPRAAGVWGFALFLVALILIALPVGLLGTLLAYPFIRPWLSAYAARLAAPTGETPVRP
jgi:hypothetical protein